MLQGGSYDASLTRHETRFKRQPSRPTTHRLLRFLRPEMATRDILLATNPIFIVPERVALVPKTALVGGNPPCLANNQWREWYISSSSTTAGGRTKRLLSLTEHSIEFSQHTAKSWYLHRGNGGIRSSCNQRDTSTGDDKTTRNTWCRGQD